MQNKLNQPPVGEREIQVAWARLKRDGDALRREAKGAPMTAQTQRILAILDLCGQLHASWLAAQR